MSTWPSHTGVINFGDYPGTLHGGHRCTYVTLIREVHIKVNQPCTHTCMSTVCDAVSTEVELHKHVAVKRWGERSKCNDLSSNWNLCRL